MTGTLIQYSEMRVKLGIARKGTMTGTLIF
jgi:hypothetical protein